MNVLLILIPVSLILGGIGLLAFWAMLRAGQFDDPEGSAARILNDPPPPEPREKAGKDPS